MSIDDQHYLNARLMEAEKLYDERQRDRVEREEIGPCTMQELTIIGNVVSWICSSFTNSENESMWNRANELKAEIRKQMGG